MIPVAREDVFSVALEELSRFGQSARARGRFIALYLGMRRMGPTLASLGPDQIATGARQIETFLDHMYTKTHRPEPFVVLTAPFGGSYSAQAPYSTRTGVTAPEHRDATNTWRNNFNIQKGIGCPAAVDTIEVLVTDPRQRLACPHLGTTAGGDSICTVRNTTYRGEEHSIWLRMVATGYQAVDLNAWTAFVPYLMPLGRTIPIFALIAMLYSFAPVDVYPQRESISIPDFADDFGFDLDTVQQMFDCDQDSPSNGRVLAAVAQQAWTTSLTTTPPPTAGAAPIPVAVPAPLPTLTPGSELNTGVGAELAVGIQLQQHGWEVEYFGNQARVGFDLRARRGDDTLFVEVKSSVAFCTPILTAEEWGAARRLGARYVVAVVDFYGGDGQRTRYLRDPAANIAAVQLHAVTYRLPRELVLPLTVEAVFL